MSGIRKNIVQVLRWVVDFLVDAAYFVAWLSINWIIQKIFRHFHPPALLIVVFLISQAIFALAILTVTGLHTWKDVISYPHQGGVIKKIRQMGKHTADMTIFATLLVIWTVFSWGFHLCYEFFESESLSIFFAHWGIQFMVGASALYRVVMELLTEIRIIYAELF